MICTLPLHAHHLAVAAMYINMHPKYKDYSWSNQNYQAHSDIRRIKILCSRTGHRTHVRRPEVHTCCGLRMRGWAERGRRRRTTEQTGRDTARPETGQIGRMSLIPALARDLGHMTSRAARLRMRSRRTTSGSCRRPSACLHMYTASVNFTIRQLTTIIDLLIYYC